MDSLRRFVIGQPRWSNCPDHQRANAFDAAGEAKPMLMSARTGSMQASHCSIALWSARKTVSDTFLAASQALPGDSCIISKLCSED